MEDYTQEFLRRIQEAFGCAPTSIISDDRPHRFSTNPSNNKDLAGIYIYDTVDGYPVGSAYDHRTGTLVTTKNIVTKDLTPDMREKINARNALQKERREEESRKRNEESHKEAKEIWQKAVKCDSHPYLDKKKISSFNAKVDGDVLLIPAYHIKDGKIKFDTIQRIYPKKLPSGTNKTFISGSTISERFAVAGTSEDKSVIYLSEGYATARTAAMLTGKVSVCCFNSSNMPKVAKALGNYYKGSRFIIVADNDSLTQSQKFDSGLVSPNTGLKSAQDSAKILTGRVSLVIPYDKIEQPVQYSDLNDLYCVEGEQVAREVIEREKSPESLDDELLFKFARKRSPSDKDSHTSMLQPHEDVDWKEAASAHLALDDKGMPKKKSVMNTLLAISHHPIFRDIFVYDEFRRLIIVLNQPPWCKEKNFKVRSITDNDIFYVQCYIERYAGLEPSTTSVKSSIESIAMRNTFNPAKEYMDSLKWDGRPRLDSWLHKTYNSNQDLKYLALVGRKWLIAGATRIFNPGAKFDAMLIIEGKQGAGKGTAFRELSTFNDESYFLDDLSFHNMNTTDMLLKLQGVIIAEVAELTGLRKSEMDQTKQWITKQNDTYVPKYKSMPVTYERQFILGASTNEGVEHGYLQDVTGNRRFWPVRCEGYVNLNWLKENKEQLWAEAVYFAKEGEEITLSNSYQIELTSKEQANRREIDPWEEAILSYMVCKPNGATMQEILNDACKVTIDKHTPSLRQRVSKVLKPNNFTMSRGYDAYGSKVRKWVKDKEEE